MATDAIKAVQVRDREDTWSKAKAYTYDVTGSASYPTGGFTITPSRFVLKSIDQIIVGGGATGAISFTAKLNTTTKKLMYMSETTGLEVAASTDVSGFSLRITFIG